MALSKNKRTKIEGLVLDVVKALDNQKMENYRRYEALFKTMTDTEFEKWARSMGHELDDTIQLYQLPFEEMKMPQIKKAAEVLEIPLEEYIWYRHDDPQGIRTKMKVPVGYVHIKRVQQLLAKKNKYAFDTEETQLKTGQVTGESKVAAISDPESFALTAINANKALEEFLGPRADAQKSKQEIYSQISRDGYATLDDKTKDPTQSTTLNTINTYLLASGFSSDLLSSSLMTPFTIERKSGVKKSSR
jgi:NADH dehydrogenase/NADH:ubiquinone oxidoreductase subunit G